MSEKLKPYNYHDENFLFVVDRVEPRSNQCGSLVMCYHFKGYHLLKDGKKGRFVKFEGRLLGSDGKGNIDALKNWKLPLKTRGLVDYLTSRNRTKVFQDIHYLSYKGEIVESERKCPGSRPGLGWLSETPKEKRKQCGRWLNETREAIRFIKACDELCKVQNIADTHMSFQERINNLSDSAKKIVEYAPKKRPEVIKTVAPQKPKAKPDTLGIIYLVRANELGRFGTRGYVGQQNNLSLTRPEHHLRGGDDCTDFLIREMHIKKCTPTFDILGQYPVEELDWREKQHYAALKEAGWSLSNRLVLVKAS